MTEVEWLAATDPGKLLAKREPIGTRKARLLAAACGRGIKHLLLHPASHRAIEVIERGADSEVPGDEWFVASYDAEGAIFSLRDSASRKHRAAANFIHSLTCDCLRGYPSRLSNETWFGQYILPAYVRDIFGNPFRPVAFDSSWRTSTVVALANQMYESRDFTPMPVLADALQDAGCDHPDILAHCRDPQPAHVRGCWVVDLILGKQ